MINYITTTCRMISAMLLLGAVFALTAPVPGAYAQSAEDAKTELCKGVNVSSGSCDGSEAGTKISDIVKVVINTLSVIVGIIAVIMIIVSGLKYINSGGEAAKINSAKESLIYAIVGIIVVSLAQFIARFVIAKSTDAPAGGGGVDGWYMLEMYKKFMV